LGGNRPSRVRSSNPASNGSENSEDPMLLHKQDEYYTAAQASLPERIHSGGHGKEDDSCSSAGTIKHIFTFFCHYLTKLNVVNGFFIKLANNFWLKK
jgi:hypothetical protein